MKDGRGHREKMGQTDEKAAQDAASAPAPKGAPRPRVPLSADFVRFATASLDLFCVADTEGWFRWVSPRWSETLGWTDDQLYAKPFVELVHPDDRAETLAEVERLSRGEPTIQFVNRFQRADGGWTWLEWTTTPTGDGLLCATGRDVTARMEASRDNERRMQLLEMSLRLGNLGYWEVDLRANTIHWSDEIYVIHGRDPASFTPDLEKGINAYHPDDRPRVQEMVQRAIDQGEPFGFELRIVRPNGEVRHVESYGEPLRDASGHITSLVGVFRDITDSATYKRKRELEQFAYLATHDLKEPVRTIATFMDLLSEDHLGVLEPPADQYWAFVRHSAGRMAELVQDLVRFARAGAPCKLEPVALSAVVAAVVHDAQPCIQEAGATMVGYEALPQVNGEPERLRRVFTNLIENGLKFCDRPTLRFAARPVGQQWEITVADDGPGIAPEFHKRIFEPFQRLQHDTEGTGMGLSIVDRIVRECGGSVWVESQPGHGTTFHLVFDRA